MVTDIEGKIMKLEVQLKELGEAKRRFEAAGGGGGGGSSGAGASAAHRGSGGGGGGRFSRGTGRGRGALAVYGRGAYGARGGGRGRDGGGYPARGAGRGFGGGYGRGRGGREGGRGSGRGIKNQSFDARTRVLEIVDPPDGFDEAACLAHFGRFATVNSVRTTMNTASSSESGDGEKSNTVLLVEFSRRVEAEAARLKGAYFKGMFQTFAPKSCNNDGCKQRNFS